MKTILIYQIGVNICYHRIWEEPELNLTVPKELLNLIRLKQPVGMYLDRDLIGNRRNSDSTMATCTNGPHPRGWFPLTRDAVILFGLQ